MDSKVCKICGEDKSLKDFKFCSTGHYLLTCKLCEGKKRKLKREGYSVSEIKIILKIPDKIFIRKCIDCKVEKEVNRDNYRKYSYKGYSRICLTCMGKNQGRPKSSDWPSANYPKKYTLFINYKKFDKKRGYYCNLTAKFLESALQSQCSYCGFPATGLDRKDNSIGHTIENCVPCCKECNIARNRNFTPEEMKLIGLGVAEVKISRLEDNLLLNSVKNLMNTSYIPSRIILSLQNAVAAA